MNLKVITDIIRRWSSSQVKTPLGRWNINNNNRETTLKIKYANEDNCGMSYITPLKISSTHNVRVKSSMVCKPSNTQMERFML